LGEGGAGADGDVGGAGEGVGEGHGAADAFGAAGYEDGFVGEGEGGGGDGWVDVVVDGGGYVVVTF